MPYRPGPWMSRPQRNWSSTFERAIGSLGSLVQRFRNHPYVLYTETDMHCYLYHRL
jgi:hypothetical protein